MQPGDAVAANGPEGTAGDLGRGHHAGHSSHVRQLRQPRDDVADGEDARLGRLLRLVDLDEAAVELDFGLLQADVGGPPGAAHGHQYLFGFLHLRLAVGVGKGHLDAGLGLFNFLHARASVHVDSAFLEEAGQLFGHVFVLYRGDARQELDNGHLSPEGAEERAEFKAHRARADDHERPGHISDGENLNVRQDAVVRGEAGQHLGLGAGGQNHVLRPHVADLAACPCHIHCVRAALRRAGQAAKALNTRDLVLFDQEVEALGVLGDDGVLALEHRLPVERRRNRRGVAKADAEVGGVPQVVPYLGIEEQRLGGNAAPVQAGAAQLVGLFNQRDLEPILRRPKSRCIPSRSAAHHRHVKNCLCQVRAPFRALVNSATRLVPTSL